MAKYITVLDSNIDNTYWKAVQVADSLEAIRANKYYNSGVSSSLDKQVGDSFVENKTVKEVSTQTTANAQVYKLSQKNSNSMKVLNSKAPKTLLKLINSKL